MANQSTKATFGGPVIDDQEILSRLPAELRGLLEQVNGFIEYGGGLHVRGACLAPAWHSLRVAWLGPNPLHALYPTVRDTDIPFAQDCLGDQFLLRDGHVIHLFAETGEIDALGVGLGFFLDKAAENPVDFLAMAPLIQFVEHEDGVLLSGQLLHAVPPFCTEESGSGVSLAAYPRQS